MLKTYWCENFYCGLYANITGEVLKLATLKKQHGRNCLTINPRIVRPDNYRARTFKTEKCERKQSAKGRLRHVIARTFRDYDHATIGTITRQVLKQAQHVALCRDNPETHLAFSPPNVGARNWSRRRSLAIGKFIRRKCQALFVNRLAISDEALENCTCLFSSGASYPLRLQLVTGIDALAVYRLHPSKGICSCMSGCEEKSDIVRAHFMKNPDILQLVVAYFSNSQLALRAKVYANSDGTHFIDRIYWRNDEALRDTTENELRDWIALWLTDQGYTISQDYDVTLRHDVGDPMPYLDRADTYTRIDDRRIRLVDSGEFCAKNTDGTDESVEDNSNRCCACDCRLSEDETYYPDSGDSYCEDCFNRRFCYVNGECHDIDDCVEVNGEYRLAEDCIEVDGEWYLAEDCVEVDGEYRLAEDCVEVDGEYHLAEDCVEVDGEWYLAEDCVEYRGEWYHQGGYVEVNGEAIPALELWRLIPAPNQLSLVFE